jgi:hypothetical protein
MTRRYPTTPQPADRDALRCMLIEAGVDRPAQDPVFVAAVLAEVVGELDTADDPVMARRIAFARALVEMVEEDLQ